MVAWLSDGATSRSEITTGSVDIRLVEEHWDAEQGANLRPNDLLPRDPRIQNKGRNDAYVFITLEQSVLPEGTALHSGTASARAGESTPLFSTETGSGLPYDPTCWQLIDQQVRYSRLTQVYAYAANNAMIPLRRGEITPAVFDGLRLANVTNTKDIEGLSTAVTVTAYAIQTAELGKEGNVSAPGKVWSIVYNYHQSKK